LKNTQNDLEETKVALQKTQEELMEMKVLAGIGSWVEQARVLVLKEFGLHVDRISMSQAWRDLLQREGEVKVLKRISHLFGMNKEEWLLVSKQFHSQSRSSMFHCCPPYDEALKLLDHLPQQYRASRETFKKMLCAVDKGMPHEDDTPL
tara:strand:+ start:1106 stop:1552 length:447 start_codon:yes stop_codon:yes gene_type:complete